MNEKNEYAVGDKVVVTGFKLSRPNRPREHYYGSNEVIERWMIDQRTLTVVEVGAAIITAEDYVTVLSEEGVSYLFHPSELRLVKAADSYPRRVRPHIDQFAENVFVWYDESGLAGGASYTLADAEVELQAYGRLLEHGEKVLTVSLDEMETRMTDEACRSLLVDTLSMLKDLSLGYDMSGLHRGLDEVLAEARALGIDTEDL